MQCRHLFGVLVGMAMLVTSSQSVADELDAATPYMAMYSFLDYDAINQATLTRCKSVAPDAGEALSKTIDQWSQHNRSALRELRDLVNNMIVESGNDKNYVAEHNAEMMSDNTKKTLEDLANTPAAKLVAYCDDYQKTLTDPGMDWVVWVQKFKATFKTN